MKTSLKDLVLKGYDFCESYPCLLESFAKAFGNDEVELNEQTLRTYMNKSGTRLGDIMEEMENSDVLYEIDEDELAEKLGLIFCERCRDNSDVVSEIRDELERLPITESAPTVVLLVEKWLDMQ